MKLDPRLVVEEDGRGASVHRPVLRRVSTRKGDGVKDPVNWLYLLGSEKQEG